MLLYLAPCLFLLLLEPWAAAWLLRKLCPLETAAWISATLHLWRADEFKVYIWVWRIHHWTPLGTAVKLSCSLHLENAFVWHFQVARFTFLPVMEQCQLAWVALLDGARPPSVRD